jgi:hypothetical protein
MCGTRPRHAASSAISAAANSCFGERAQFGERGFRLRGIAPGDHHGRPGLRQSPSDTQTDATIATGDKRNATGKIEH